MLWVLIVEEVYTNRYGETYYDFLVFHMAGDPRYVPICIKLLFLDEKLKSRPRG